MRALVYRSGVRRKRAVPDELREAVLRRAYEAGGVVLIGLGAATALSLVTWSAQDPSFNNAVDGAAKNLLGTPGAFIADVLMQTFGLGSISLIFPVTAWGWRLALHRTLDREKLRLLAWLFASLAGASFAASLTPPASWPLPSGLGGITGDGIVHALRLMLPSSGMAAGALSAALGLGAAFLAFVAAGFAFHDDMPELTKMRRRAEAIEEDEEEPEAEEEDDYPEPKLDARSGARDADPFDFEEEGGHGFAPFGLVVHYWLAMKSGFGRMLRGGAFMHTERDAGRVGMRDLLRRLDQDGEEIDEDEDYETEEPDDEDEEEAAPARRAAAPDSPRPGRGLRSRHL